MTDKNHQIALDEGEAIRLKNIVLSGQDLRQICIHTECIVGIYKLNIRSTLPIDFRRLVVTSRGAENQKSPVSPSCLIFTARRSTLFDTRYKEKNMATVCAVRTT